MQSRSSSPCNFVRSTSSKTLPFRISYIRLCTIRTNDEKTGCRASWTDHQQGAPIRHRQMTHCASEVLLAHNQPPVQRINVESMGILTSLSSICHGKRGILQVRTDGNGGRVRCCGQEWWRSELLSRAYRRPHRTPVGTGHEICHLGPASLPADPGVSCKHGTPDWNVMPEMLWLRLRYSLGSFVCRPHYRCYRYRPRAPRTMCLGPLSCLCASAPYALSSRSPYLPLIRLPVRTRHRRPTRLPCSALKSNRCWYSGCSQSTSTVPARSMTTDACDSLVRPLISVTAIALSSPPSPRTTSLLKSSDRQFLPRPLFDRWHGPARAISPSTRCCDAIKQSLPCASADQCRFLCPSAPAPTTRLHLASSLNFDVITRLDPCRNTAPSPATTHHFSESTMRY